MNIWYAILGMGLITFAIRLLPILLLERFTLNPSIQQALKYVPVAVLSAIILPEMVYPGGTFDLSLGNERLLAGLVAIGIAWWRKDVLLTIGGGMGVLWLLQWSFSL